LGDSNSKISTREFPLRDGLTRRLPNSRVSVKIGKVSLGKGEAT